MKRILVLLLAVASCSDPVKNAQKEALGPEDPSVPRGETHRPGQPCLVCHDDFDFAGTVYNEDRVTPFEGATVSIIDAAGNNFTGTTNSVGNFIIRKGDTKPVFPVGAYTDDASGNQVVGVTVTGTDPQNVAQMITHIGRNGGCAACHTADGPSSTSPGPIYITVVTP